MKLKSIFGCSKIINVCAAFAFAFGGVLSVANAASADPGKPESAHNPGQEFRIASDCIGAPRSPKCTIETYLACFERRDPRLCAIVGVPDEPERAELGLRLIGLEIPKEYSLDFIDDNAKPNPQWRRVFWIVRERYCVVRGDRCIALPWHEVIYQVFGNGRFEYGEDGLMELRKSTGLVIKKRSVGAPASSLPSEIRRVDAVERPDEIFDCAKPNAPEHCEVTLFLGCRKQGICREYWVGPFYRADYLARPDEYIEYRIVGRVNHRISDRTKEYLTIVHYDVRYCPRTERNCEGREWLPGGDE